jgi:magnesium transporter
LEEKQNNRAVIDIDEELLDDISDLISSKSEVLLQNILADIYPSDIALIIDNLDDQESFWLFNILDFETAAEVLTELGDHKRDFFLDRLEPEKISKIVGRMDSDDATDIIGELEDDVATDVLSKMETEDSSEVKELLAYDENTAGGIMQKEFVDVKETDTIQEAINEIKREASDNEHLYQVWVTDSSKRLKGQVSLKNIILAIDTPSMIIADIMDRNFISVDINTDQEEVAKIMRNYDLVSLPVVDDTKKLIGRITIDDVVDVLEEEFSEDVAKIVGSDAEELESKSPFQIAWLRLPWVLITLGIEFCAGIVIHYYDETLTKMILLASFMPIISAISGNTGLQSAAITVRALATGHASLSKWWTPIRRSVETSFIIGAACGIVIGTVAGLWGHKWLFGLLVGFSMFISINISGFVGASVPMLSKKLGFDPALTAGPFETAFQDVVGITIFLSLATLLVHLIM